MGNDTKSPSAILFGSRQNHDAFEIMRQDLEQILNITLTVVESSYSGYDEYASYSQEGYTLSLVHNWDDYDEEPIEAEFADYELLFKISVVEPYPQKAVNQIVEKLENSGDKWNFLQKRVYRKIHR